ncbi:ABC transporter ATP-binding protein [Jeotgalicoccus huakuii]|uniref:ATP-binding cassette domain-containing protein n=1 Tax=Jeotgalicoccus TaxID=227979 RepID=UPI0004180F05|nr:MULTISPECIES: ABC transporter ATP-binding protein [Jeotgalicoccus]MCK1975875.1 ABC transporter ATP-binding protein [Jeotgalicoccus huakuii]QQD84840.1 ABC transporter ATP-binding protein [Jeotgalicoccus sp. ATCC 8456]
MLDIHSLVVDYDDFKIIVESLIFEPGLHVLIGENGSGKSSVLTGVTGFNTKSIKKRELYVDNHKLSSTAEYISYLPQHNVPFQINVEDFVGLSTEKKISGEQFIGILNDYDLIHYRNHSIENLSGGEFKRALLAQIELEDKPIIMLDEIEQGLDVNYQHIILSRLKELAKNKVVILAMHDLSLAMTYADSISGMKKGTLTAAKVPNHQVTEEMLSHIFSREMKVIRQGNKVAVLS